MDPMLVGSIGIVTMLTLIIIGVPIGYALLLVGAVGNTVLTGIPQTAVQLNAIIWDSGTNFLLIALPLFVLMGQLAYKAGIATDLYDCIYKWFGWLPGGLAVTGTITSAGFGAVTGSSFATVHTMGSMVMPEMKRYNYDLKLAAGSIASAGTLAILIPPSIMLVIYGIFTETDIGALFVAGILPGILLTLGFSGYIIIRCLINPELGPRGPSFSWTDRFVSLKKLLPALAIFILVLGGIYGGLFTPNEAAGIGAAGVFLVATLMRRMTWEVLRISLLESASVSGTIFVILMGGMLMSRFLVQTDITPSLIQYISDVGANRYLIMILFIVMYLFLGAVLDVLAMLVLTLPFVFPIVIQLGFDPVWFGIFITIMIELALITPPVGLNVYIMQTVAPDVSLSDIFRGVLPFTFICLGLVLLLLAFPEIAMWLPNLAFG